MATSPLTRSKESSAWGEAFRREGYYLKQTIIARLFYGVIAAYFTISIPFHFTTFLVGNTDVFLRFPDWYSAALLPFLLAQLVFTWYL